MASSIIHLIVAKKVNEQLKKDENLFYLGAIAPDLAKLVGKEKSDTHFSDKNIDINIPYIDRFVDKYGSDLHKPFELGYLVHLLTDLYWFRDYIPFFIKEYHDEIKQTGTYNEDHTLEIYADYSNCNLYLLDEHLINLDILYNELPSFTTVIKEIDIAKLSLLTDMCGITLINSNKTKKFYILDVDEADLFIEQCVNSILEDLKYYNIKL